MPLLGAYELWAEKDFYRATTAVTRGPAPARCAGPGIVFVGLNPIDFFYVKEINLEMMARFCRPYLINLSAWYLATLSQGSYRCVEHNEKRPLILITLSFILPDIRHGAI